MRRAVALDPRNAQTALALAETYTDIRRYDEAEPYYELSISLAPDQTRAYWSKTESYVSWDGSLKKARATLKRAPNANPGDYAWMWFIQERYERSFEAAFDRLTVAPDPIRPFVPKSLMLGFGYLLLDQPQLAQASCESARPMAEKQVGDNPHNPMGRLVLAETYTCLGRKAEAIREVEHAVELLPLSRDAILGAQALWHSAAVHAWLGEHDTAIDRLATLLSIPSSWSIWDLRLDPRWDALRDHPRFRELVGEDWQAEPLGEPEQ